MNHFKALAAMSLNRVIGNAGKIPWHLPEDFKWFKQMTAGQVIVMGRKTFESIGRALPNRETVVLSKSGFITTGARVVQDIAELDLTHETRDVFVTGGAQIYAQMLPLCSDLYLTVVQREVQGDTFFPAFENDFELIATDSSKSTEFNILHYRNLHINPLKVSSTFVPLAIV